MRIGILTGGGDVPGLNTAIKAVVNRAASEGHEVVGIRRGWGGLLDTEPDDLESAAREVARWRSTPEWCGRSTARDVPAYLAYEPGQGQGAADEPAFLTSGRVDEVPATTRITCSA